MAFDYRQVLKISALSGLALLLFNQVRSLFETVKDMGSVSHAEVCKLEDITEILTKKQSSKLKVLKLQPYYFQTQQYKLQIRSAQKLRQQPSDVQIVQKITKKLSKPTGLSIFPDNQSIQWFAGKNINKKSSQRQYEKIIGFGTIKGDFFDIRKQYEPKKNLGYRSRFFNWLYVKLHQFSDAVYETKYVNSIFYGPIIGILKYEVNLMKDLKILAVCNIEDGKILPIVTATSKSQILNYYNGLINEKYIKVGCTFVISILICRWLWSDIKKYLNALKVRRHKISKRFAETVDDEKMCIICYTNCRNVLFFDCRHMVMCHECSQSYNSDVCPLCKLQIDDIKAIHGIQ